MRGRSPHTRTSASNSSTRWKDVRFDFRHLYCPEMYTLALAESNTPLLRTFEFHARDVSNINVAQITRLLSSSPALREVTWVDDLADTALLLQLPLSRLTRLSLAMDHGTVDYLQVLNHCSNLEHIRITRPFSLTQTAQSPLWLGKLTSLNISYDLTGILDYLVLPALRDVRIYAEGMNRNVHARSLSQPDLLAHHHHHQPASTSSVEGWDPASFISLIDRSDCTIHTLSLKAPMTEAALALLLHHTTSLRKLSIEGVAITDTLLERMTRRSPGDSSAEVEVEHEESHLCPHLNELALHTPLTSTPGMLFQMIESRLCFPASKSCSSLIKLRILDGHKDLDKLRELSRASGADERGRGEGEGGFRLEVVPRKGKGRRRSRVRNYLFRRKVCASR
ncbi:hypothetical protein B0H34DRAFT_163560 [Crassisporium funariophilum]|nr:hypothetical protein B0H34DRAFT_163560 [Crassisporium funariophilum]